MFNLLIMVMFSQACVIAKINKLYNKYLNICFDKLEKFKLAVILQSTQSICCPGFINFFGNKYLLSAPYLPGPGPEVRAIAGRRGRGCMWTGIFFKKEKSLPSYKCIQWWGTNNNVRDVPLTARKNKANSGIRSYQGWKPPAEILNQVIIETMTTIDWSCK